MQTWPLKLIIYKSFNSQNTSLPRKSIAFTVIIFIDWSIYSFVRSFVPLFLCSFVRSFVPLFLCSFIRFFVPSFVRSFVLLLLLSFLRSFFPSVLPSFVPFVPSFSLSLLHLSVRSSVFWFEELYFLFRSETFSVGNGKKPIVVKLFCNFSSFIFSIIDVPILGTEPDIAKLYSMKSGVCRVFEAAGVSRPPEEHDIYSLQQVSVSTVEPV